MDSTMIALLALGYFGYTALKGRFQDRLDAAEELVKKMEQESAAQQEKIDELTGNEERDLTFKTEIHVGRFLGIRHYMIVLAVTNNNKGFTYKMQRPTCQFPSVFGFQANTIQTERDTTVQVRPGETQYITLLKVCAPCKIDKYTPDNLRPELRLFQKNAYDDHLYSRAMQQYRSGSYEIVGECYYDRQVYGYDPDVKMFGKSWCGHVLRFPGEAMLPYMSIEIADNTGAFHLFEGNKIPGDLYIYEVDPQEGLIDSPAYKPCTAYYVLGGNLEKQVAAVYAVDDQYKMTPKTSYGYLPSAGLYIIGDNVFKV